VKNNSAPEESKQTDGTIDGPGSQLRKARERQGLDQAKIAAQLHLSQAMIQALEWDDYEELPSPVFVQGYLRNYARLLGVKEEAVIRAYQALNPSKDQAPLPRNQPDEVAKELHVDHRLTRFMSLVVVLVLGALLFFWWQGRMDQPEPEPEPASMMDGSDNATTGFSLPDQSESATQTLPDTAMPPMDESLLPGEAESPAESAQPELTPEPDSGSIPQAAEPPAVEAPVLSSSESVETPDTEPAVAEAPSMPSDAGTMVFEFSGPCWVEVRDSTGRLRIIGEMREGVRKTLDAQLGPFKVVFGDVNAVRLTINGTPYNIARHARGKVARFTLDPSQL
jgi:cytoskeleton protein RodZ